MTLAAPWQLARANSELSGAGLYRFTSPSSRNFSTRKAMRVSMHPMNRSSHSCSATTASAIADRMRNDYLTVLGARHDWRNFLDQYSRFVLNDDTQVKCYALEARASRGETWRTPRAHCSSIQNGTAMVAST